MKMATDDTSTNNPARTGAGGMTGRGLLDRYHRMRQKYADLAPEALLARQLTIFRAVRELDRDPAATVADVTARENDIRRECAEDVTTRLHVHALGDATPIAGEPDGS